MSNVDRCCKERLCIGVCCSERRRIYRFVCLSTHIVWFYLFFFFQAEDGIRDLTVTGVQTCALPILGETFQPWPSSRAAAAPVPSVALPPCPLAPVGFSALIERVWALESRVRLPRCM